MIGNQNTCVLMIEDNPADVQLLRFALDEVGLPCRLTAIHDGFEALQWARQFGEDARPHDPALVILDLNLPKHDGFEILEEITRNPRLAGLPVLVLSSSASPRDVARVHAFPNTQYMTKPVVLDDYGNVARMLSGMLAGRNRESASGAG